MSDAARERVEAVLRAAARVSAVDDALGVKARARLPDATGLSPEGVALALDLSVERSASPTELTSLLAWAGAAPRVHVVLSAGVFVAAVRALALAVAAAADVVVRPSRRDPLFAELLVEALARDAGGARVALASELTPGAGEHVHAYGRDETLDAIARRLGPEVVVRGHGTGLGLAAVGATDALDEAADALALDVALFDQRGCLSPRAAIVEGDAARVEAFAAALDAALARREALVPRGRLHESEREAMPAFRATAHLAGSLREGASWSVGAIADARALVLPPPGRNVAVLGAVDAARATRLVAPLAGLVTSVGGSAGSAFVTALTRAAPHARPARLGEMQRPALDGPVDRRRAERARLC